MTRRILIGILLVLAGFGGVTLALDAWAAWAPRGR